MATPLPPSPTTSFDVRAELEALVERDLLGPWDGPTEELPPADSPAERYLLGRLVPRRDSETETATAPTPLPEEAEEPLDEPDLVDREITEAGVDLEAPVSQAAVRSGSIAASAMGLSFSVPDMVDELTVTAAWGRYERSPSEIHETEQGRPRTVWRRVPAEGACDVDLRSEGTATYVPVADQDGVKLRVAVRNRGRLRIVDVSLLNGQPHPPSTPDTARLYQVSLTVTPLDAAAPVFLGHNDPDLISPPSTADDERLRLALLYRQHRRYGHGRQCAVDADVRPGELRAWRLRTTCFPAADVPLTVAAAPSAMPGLVLDMARLGSPELARDDLVRGLRPLVSGYRSWLDQREAEASTDPEVQRFQPAPDQLMALARQLADRLERAIDLLRDDAVAREAFRFANQAMALQRVRSEVARIRLQDPSRSLSSLLAELDVPARRSWRPFQLAFVLLCLPGLTDPAHADAHRGTDDGEVELLFFPTGGGKTESYLGLSAYTFAIRRLQGVVGTGPDARDGSAGVAVLMRYTLRLLTAQQFQRAAALLCACEWLRRERVAGGDGRWGTTPFRVGLWVGAKVAPNNFDEAQRQIDERQGDGNPAGALQLLACPWCGSKLGNADLRSDRARRRVILYCSDPEGDCPFAPRNSPGEGIPVLTVDEEIYRLTPALVIATVDKLAQLPWKAATATLFGLVDQHCPRHGWRNPDFDKFCPTRHQAAGDLPAVQAEAVLRLRPPDLIIQDELHLISDALGSLVGLYETAIDLLCTRRDGERTIRPALVASTATVRRAADQVEKVFARQLTMFPPQVLDAGDTFFSKSVPPGPDTPSRRYRGILATGERLTSIEIRVAASVMEHAQSLFDRFKVAADPYMTLVDYFSSTRELAGMRRLVDDDITERLSSLRVRTQRRPRGVQELTSRMASDRIAATLAELERPFDPAFDSTAGREAIRQLYRSDRPAASKRLEGHLSAVDVLLATSMLQVGVDVPRLGLMVVTGQPKNTAEYIQATSRVGRDPRRPGVVFTIYQWSRPRDLAYYEDFAYYHSVFGSRVEGLTTTPFSQRALDRGLTAVLVTCLRHSSMDALRNTAAGQLDLGSAAVEDLLAAIRARAAQVLHDVDAADAVLSKLRQRIDRWRARRQQLQTGRLGYEAAADVTGLLQPPEAATWDIWTAPRSLREVEPEILLQVKADDPSMADAPAWQYASEQPA